MHLSGGSMFNHCPPELDHYEAYCRTQVAEMVRRSHRGFSLLGDALAFLLGSCLGAQAADLNKAPVPVAVPYVATVNWSGLSFGINGGYGFDRSGGDQASGIGGPLDLLGYSFNGGTPVTFKNPVHLGSWGPAAQSLNENRGGAVFGGQVGLTAQTGYFVYGAELMGDWSGVKGAGQAATGMFTPNLGSAITPTVGGGALSSTSLNWFAALAGKVGFSPWNDVLFYGKAGYALGGYTASDAFSGSLGASATGLSATGSFTQAGSASGTKGGFTWGGGIAYKLGTSGWSLRAEYDEFDFGSVTVNAPGVATGSIVSGKNTITGNFGPISTASISHDLTTGMILIGADYKLPF